MTSNWNIVNCVFGLSGAILNDNSRGGKSSLELFNHQYLVVVKGRNVVLDGTFQKEDLAALPVLHRKRDLFSTYRLQCRQFYYLLSSNLAANTTSRLIESVTYGKVAALNGRFSSLIS